VSHKRVSTSRSVLDIRNGPTLMTVPKFLWRFVSRLGSCRFQYGRTPSSRTHTLILCPKAESGDWLYTETEDLGSRRLGHGPRSISTG
jgi:hypothetical protein